MMRPEPMTAIAPTLSLRVAYEALGRSPRLAANTLAVLGFGTAPRLPDDPRCIRVGLTPLRGGELCEVWSGAGPVHSGRDGLVRFSCDDEFLFGAIELDESGASDLACASEAVYREIYSFRRRGQHPHLLRCWNYLDAINSGVGDQERYKQFCVGRARGMGDAHASIPFPAATAIGRRDGDPILQVFWLASRSAGQALENPRQVSAFCYPREYGPAAPSFSRAMLMPGPTLLVSGTASVVGHATHHRERVLDQLRESLINLACVRERAHALVPAFGSSLADGTLLKVYIRDPTMLADVEEMLRQKLPTAVSFIILHGDICRNDLLVELDAHCVSES